MPDGYIKADELRSRLNEVGSLIALPGGIEAADAPKNGSRRKKHKLLSLTAKGQKQLEGLAQEWRRVERGIISILEGHHALTFFMGHD
jgi:hypothetical protein